MCRKMEDQRFLGVFGREMQRKEGENYLEKMLRDPKFIPIKISSGRGRFGHFIGKKVPSAPLRVARLMSAILSFSSFLVLNLSAYLKAFPDSDCAYLGVPGKFQMSSFQKTKENEIPTVGSKFMASGSELTHLACFSRYLNCFNSDFDP